MLKNVMEDRKLDLGAPLLSARRFSAEAAGSRTPSATYPEEEGNRWPPRRSSLPFYSSDLKSGSVRAPGVIPFGWERNGAIPTSGGDGRPLAASKAAFCRVFNDKERAAAAPAVKPGNSVRTRKTVTFALDAGTAKSSEFLEGGSPQAVEKEEVVEQQVVVKVEEKPQQQPISAGDKHEEEEDDDDDAFSDALDTHSRTESLSMNCSVSGVSGIPDAAKLSSSTPKDHQVRDFMMERFLPAAKAMTCESPQYIYRKAASPVQEVIRPVERVVIKDSRRPVPVLYQNWANYVPELEEGDTYGDDEEDEEDCDDAGHLPSKACGLLTRFCLNSSFCLLNPAPGLKVRGRLPPLPRGRIGNPQIKKAHPISLGRFEAEVQHSWEAVYKDKVGQRCQTQVEGGKLRNESNQLAYRSDSLTADGSSPCQHSATGGTSSYLNEADGRKGYLGVLSKESKGSRTGSSDLGEKNIWNHWKKHSSEMDSGSASPSLERTVYVDSANMPRSSDSKLSSWCAVKDTGSMMSSGEVGTETRRMEESIVVEAHERDVLQSEVSKFAEPVLPLSSARLNQGDISGDNNLKHGDSGSDQLHPKNNVKSLQSLLPPLLPKSPSESWLSRTLPSVMSKNPAPRSLLGIQFQPKKQTLQAYSVDAKQERIIKPSKAQHREIRFAEVLAKLETPKSEI